MLLDMNNFQHSSARLFGKYRRNTLQLMTNRKVTLKMNSSN